MSNLPTPIENAIAVATLQWHAAKRNYEQLGRAFADAETQLHHAERDLHELARAIELHTANPLTPGVMSTAGAPVITLAPSGTGGPPIGGLPSDGLDAAEIVRQEMIKMRTGG